MPSLIGSLYVSLTADFSSFQRNMKSAEAVTSNAAAGMRRSMGVTTKAVGGLQRSFNSGVRPGALIAAGRAFDSTASRANLLRGTVFGLTAAFGGLGAALTTNVISRYLDTFTGLENQIRVVSKSALDLSGNLATVQAVAERSRSSLAAVGTLYSRIAKASPEQGTLATLRRVETVNKALQLGGATAQESASAAIQFSQAIASNRLGGEELRAVLETPLGLELAKGLGVTIGKLREMGYEGKLTADVLFKALDRISGTIDRQFADSVSTIDQGLAVVDGQLTTYAGKMDDAYGVTRQLTSGIRSFGDNLDTIIPLLAQAGLLIGSLYAGRLAARAGGGTFGRAVAAIKAENAARKESLALAQKQFESASKNYEIARKQAKDSAVDPSRAREFAAPASIKQYQRSLQALQKEDRRNLGLIENTKQARIDLGAITTQTTAASVRAAEAQSAAEAKLNKALRDRQNLRGLRNQADKQLFSAFGGGDKDVIAKTKASIKDIEREELASQKRIVAAREELVRRQIATSNLQTKAEVDAARERVAALNRIARADAELERSNQKRAVLSQATRGAGSLADTSGLIGVNQRALDSTAGLIRAQSEVLKTGSALATAARQAGILATSLGVLRTAGASLVGFLGGPWGVALTAATVLLGYLGASAARTAESVANAQRLINETLGNIGGQDTQALNQELAIVAQIEQARKNITDLGIAVDEFKIKIGEAITDSNGSRLAASVATSVKGFADQLGAGSISLQQFNDKMENLKRINPSLAKQIDDAREYGAQVAGASRSLDFFKDALNRLNGAKAEVSVNVSVIDPLGVFSGKPFNPVKGLMADYAKQYEQYGRGRKAMLDANRADEFKKGVISRAGEEDKVKNTPQKIKDRAQALLEESNGLIRTRQEAEALAREELDLEEATRLAGQSAGKAAKDYERFTDKIAELRQEASGAFMSDLDRDVLDQAKTLKNGSEMMEQYINALNSGDLSQAPKELLQVRDALMQIGAADTWRDIIDRYGEGAQLAGMFADKQAELNFLIAQGNITAAQGGQAWADFIGEFREFEWIDQTADALSGFVEAVVTDFENIEDAFKNLLSNLAKIVLEETVLNPLRGWFRSLMGEVATGFKPGGGGSGGGGGIVGSVVGAVGSVIGGGGGSESNYAPGAVTRSPLGQVGSGAQMAGSVGAFTTANRMAGAVGRTAGLAAARSAIKQIESGGNYSVVGAMSRKGDRPYGAYQIMGENVGPWSKAATGTRYSPQQFLRNPAAQDATFDHRFGGYAKKYGMRGAAEAWIGGPGAVGKRGEGPSDVLGTSVREYADKFERSIGKIETSSGSAAEAVTKMATDAAGAGEGLTKLSSALSQFPSAPGGGGGGGGGLFGSLFGGGMRLAQSALSPLALAGVMGGAGGLYHSGGTVGAGGRPAMFNMAAFKGARRYHSGKMRSNEIPALLELGEEVLTKKDARRTSRVMSGLTGGKNGSGMRERERVDVRVSFDEDDGFRAYVQNEADKSSGRAVKGMNDALPTRIKQINADPRRR